MKILLICGCAILTLSALPATAADYRLTAAVHRVEVLEEAAPADAIPDDIAAQLSATGMRVIRGSSRKLCDIWLCKQWDLPEEVVEADDILFPFQPGQLIGVIRFNNKGADFRDQEIAKGVYTLRYAHQPVDGDHVGTAPARDFLVLVKIADEQSAAVLDYDTLVEKSADAAETTHPAQMMLQRAEGDAKTPSIRHIEENDWWSVRGQGQANYNGQSKNMQIEFIVVGHADE